MTCTRCSGLIVWDFDEALGRPNMRCIQCGGRPLDPPPRPPDPHHLTKEKVGNLTTCRCGESKVEWRSYCRKCSLRKLNKEQRRIHNMRNGPKSTKTWQEKLNEGHRPDKATALREARKDQ